MKEEEETSKVPLPGHTAGRSCEDTARRQEPTGQEERFIGQKPTPTAPWSRTCSLQSCEKVNLCCWSRPVCGILCGHRADSYRLPSHCLLSSHHPEVGIITPRRALKLEGICGLRTLSQASHCWVRGPCWPRHGRHVAAAEGHLRSAGRSALTPSSGRWLPGFPPPFSAVFCGRPHISLMLSAGGPRGSVLAPLPWLSVSTPRRSQQVPGNCYRLALVRLPPRLCPKRWHSRQGILVNMWVRSSHSFALLYLGGEAGVLLRAHKVLRSGYLCLQRFCLSPAWSGFPRLCSAAATTPASLCSCLRAFSLADFSAWDVFLSRGALESLYPQDIPVSVVHHWSPRAS